MDRHDRSNYKNPVINFRCPSRDHHRQVVEAAAKEGISISEWMRRLVAKELAPQR